VSEQGAERRKKNEKLNESKNGRKYEGDYGGRNLSKCRREARRGNDQEKSNPITFLGELPRTRGTLLIRLVD